ncbi:hypothetical protein CEXT_498351, partial [Caerostris extrusa]
RRKKNSPVQKSYASILNSTVSQGTQTDEQSQNEEAPSREFSKLSFRSVATGSACAIKPKLTTGSASQSRPPALNSSPSSLSHTRPNPIPVNNKFRHPGIDEAVDRITYCILEATKTSIPKTVERLPKLNKQWWTEECAKAHKDQKRAWDRLRRYPTSENLLRFKRLKAVARRIRRQSQRASWQKNVSGIQGQISSKKNCGKG